MRIKKSRPAKLLRKIRFALDSHGRFPIAAPGSVWNDGKVTVHFDADSKIDKKVDVQSLIRNPTPGSLLEYMVLENAMDLD